MNKVDRRHFLMTSMALPVALKASALREPNERSEWPSLDSTAGARRTSPRI